MRVLVTGGAGFIGANLCRVLTATPGGDEVIAIDDLSTGSKENLAGVEARLVQGTILDRDLLRESIEGADCVVHLAARPSVPRSLQDPVASHESNATGTVYVLEAAREAGAHVIVASSSSIYGSTVELPKHENLPARPLSPYGASKLAAEAYALAWGQSFGTPTLAFRFFNVYGPLQPAGHAYAAVIPTFIEAALSGNPLPVNGDGRQTRDFTYVGTVCSVLLAAVRSRVTSAEPVNLAFGTRVTLLELIDMLGVALGRGLPVEHRPERAGDIRDSQASSEQLQRLFPAVTPVPLSHGLVETVAWFQRRSP